MKKSAPRILLLLARFREVAAVAALLAVEEGREAEAVRLLQQRTDVLFAELDRYAERCFQPNHPQLPRQWLHATLNSEAAWNHGLGAHAVRLAIIDTPFQMDHPDLAANTVPGWDLVSQTTIVVSSGIEHSTAAAGLVAAVLNNQAGA